VFDLILRGGDVVDGTGAPRFLADVAVQGDRIAAVAPDLPVKGILELDVRERIVCPGWIFTPIRTFSSPCPPPPSEGSLGGASARGSPPSWRATAATAPPLWFLVGSPFSRR